jgi:hypothetical protein
MRLHENSGKAIQVGEGEKPAVELTVIPAK